MIDSEWFYRRLEQDGRSLRDMARALGMDASAVSRMLRGERKMSADEQDELAGYLGVSLVEVAARRRGEAFGFSERQQEGLKMDYVAGGRVRKNTSEDGASPSEENVKITSDSFYDRIRGCMKGTVTVMPGVDLTEPADPEWAKVYDD